ncbi:MAG: protein translocase subunit SecD [Coriobacteriia bacterium]|nr:protein translocase subunit SecD [Coriobacteriia bacterium]
MNPRQRNYLLLALAAMLVIGSWVLFMPPATKITQGLDIKGGLSVILKATPSQGQTLTNADMDRAIAIIQNRVNKLGASEASIQKQGSDSILVQMPGVKNSTTALQIIGETGRLEFVDVSSLPTATQAAIAAWVGVGAPRDSAPELPAGLAYTPVLTGDVITNATAGQNSQNTGQLSVTLSMNSAGMEKWGAYTTANIGKQVAIVLDGVVQSAPQIQSAIVSGNTEITGSFTVDEAKYLATVLQTGSLPVKLEPVDTRAVGATLGQDSLRQGVIAALVGLLIVAVYLLIFYRGMGAVSVLGLLVFASMFLGLLAAMSAFNLFALSLPGIAGIVLTIGLAADSSILINERFREEISMGKTYRSAALSSTRHAIGTSVDADLVTFVSALALFAIAIGPVRGFALTLMLGIACDIIMMVIFSRPLIILLAEGALRKAPAFWGIPKETTQTRVGASGKRGGSGA